MQKNGVNGHQHEASEKRLAPGAFPPWRLTWTQPAQGAGCLDLIEEEPRDNTGWGDPGLYTGGPHRTQLDQGQGESHTGETRAHGRERIPGGRLGAHRGPELRRGAGNADATVIFPSPVGGVGTEPFGYPCGWRSAQGNPRGCPLQSNVPPDIGAALVAAPE